MAVIKTGSNGIVAQAKQQQRAEARIKDLVEAVKKDRSRAHELLRVDLKRVTATVQRSVAGAVLAQLRGQLPPGMSKALADGTADPALLGKLLERLANSTEQGPQANLAKAATAEAARAAARDPEIPTTALRWSSFVQKTTKATNDALKGKAGSAAPKGDGAIAAEESIQARTKSGPGLRNPKPVDIGIEKLGKAHKGAIMVATAGDGLTRELGKLGINDPMSLVSAGALPSDRALLAKRLGIPRGRLFALMMRAELLQIGPGRNGELAMRPDMLDPLLKSGVAMLSTLAALRSLSPDEFKKIFRLLHMNATGFSSAVRGRRVPSKRDLTHWARTAARLKSDISLTDFAALESAGRDDAQDLVQAWYMENLLWNTLEDARREQDHNERDRQRRDADEPEREELHDLDFDEEREDNLMCFWITDHGASVTAGGVRRMYVCIDPASGAIIPQSIEQEGVPA